MKHYSEFTKQYVQDICDALNETGEVMDKITNRSFAPENFDSLRQLLQDYVVRSQDYFTYLNDKGLVNRGRCPYTGERIDETFPSWSFMRNRRVYLSHEGIRMLQKEDDEDYERLYGHPRPKKNVTSGRSGGCYIATVCYGSEFAPEVVTLKKYRDNYLSKHWYGRLFIKTYYFFSPPIANALKTKEKVNSFIKNKILNKIVQKISKL